MEGLTYNLKLTEKGKPLCLHFCTRGSLVLRGSGPWVSWVCWSPSGVTHRAPASVMKSFTLRTEQNKKVEEDHPGFPVDTC